MKLRNKTIAITIGDPSGVGPEVTSKALRSFKLPKHIKVFVIGDLMICRGLGIAENSQIEIIPSGFSFEKLPTLGKPARLSGLAAKSYLDQAIALVKSKQVDALVTAPVSKEAISLVDKSFVGHTEYLAKVFKKSHVDMMFVAEDLKMVLATRHLAVKNIAKEIKKENILKTILLTDKALKNLFKIRNPKIAVCGFNPHAGEGGLLGKEDQKEIFPAIKQAQELKIRASGPYSADTIFVAKHRREFDAIIAMYHDQGLAPMKALYFNGLVNLTIGLDFIRTSPAHGTAFNIAGKKRADPTSMIEAIKLAIKLSELQ